MSFLVSISTLYNIINPFLIYNIYKLWIQSRHFSLFYNHTYFHKEINYKILHKILSLKRNTYPSKEKFKALLNNVGSNSVKSMFLLISINAFIRNISILSQILLGCKQNPKKQINQSKYTCRPPFRWQIFAFCYYYLFIFLWTRGWAVWRAAGQDWKGRLMWVA